MSSSSKTEPDWDVKITPGLLFFANMTIPAMIQYPLQFKQYQRPFMHKIFRSVSAPNLKMLQLFIGLPLLMGGASILFDASNSFKHPSQALERNRIERAKLMTQGIFSKTRHPIYCGSILMQAGMSILCNNGVIAFNLALYLLWLNLYVLRVEEKGCIDYFGTQYTEYMKRTNRWYFF